jgi:peptidoglycan/LPS O-acetylase OafA/YrhL
VSVPIALGGPSSVIGDEAGTPPRDRPFRPDVEGLRAVAVLLVVLFHADIPRISGGFVGVDVFFVISGFVITGLLLRERATSGRTSILHFYARRMRRILPAATLVVLTTVAVGYLKLGVVAGNSIANDGRWAAVFLANFHFEALGTNYFTATLPPSPLQNYWSLSVEEQFYVVYPTLFLLVAWAKVRISLEAKLAIVLGAVIAVSYWLSVVQTQSHPTAAYFSPGTRAWEISLGALIAVGSSWLRRLPVRVAALATWAGMAAIVTSACAFTASTAYPGSLVAIPVLGAGLVIAGGVVVPRWGAEALLGLGPLQWLGRRSYGLYLWHWPVLIIAAEYYGKSRLAPGANILLVLVAMALAAAMYRFVEEPFRHWSVPSAITVVAGAVVVVGTVVLLTMTILIDSSSKSITIPVVPAANTATVLRAVGAAAHITSLPNPIRPSLTAANNDFGGNYANPGCSAGLQQAKEKLCVLGDPDGSDLMVVYGDSHALMWLPAFSGVAKAAHWRLIVLGKSDCPAPLIAVPNPPGLGTPGAPYAACAAWHRWAVTMIRRLHPDLLVISTQDLGWPAAAWHAGLTNLYSAVIPSSRRVIYLGSIPLLPQAGPTCLGRHPNNVQACSVPASVTRTPLTQLDRAVTAAAGAKYVDPFPWFCSSICTAVIGHYDVYLDQFHITASYGAYLQNALADSLDLRAVPAGR